MVHFSLIRCRAWIGGVVVKIPGLACDNIVFKVLVANFHCGVNDGNGYTFSGTAFARLVHIFDAGIETCDAVIIERRHLLRRPRVFEMPCIDVKRILAAHNVFDIAVVAGSRQRRGSGAASRICRRWVTTASASTADNHYEQHRREQQISFHSHPHTFQAFSSSLTISTYFDK